MSSEFESFLPFVVAIDRYCSSHFRVAGYFDMLNESDVKLWKVCMDKVVDGGCDADLGSHKHGEALYVGPRG